MLKCYVPKRFSGKSLAIINKSNELLEYYASHRIDCTLRSLYYRLVAQNVFPNTLQSYKRLGSILGDARLAGRMRWDVMEDTTRNLAALQHFNGVQDAVDKVSSWYHIDMWANQKYRPEVWIEKNALVGNIARACRENDVPFLSCRGYTSITAMWEGSERMRQYGANGQVPYIIHLGDHDPSGVDMSRDIAARLRSTFGADCQFLRLALNMDQIKQKKLPPQPAKKTDSRLKKYREKFGDESWEVDALDPIEFFKLVADAIDKVKDKQQWQEAIQEKVVVQEQLKDLAQNWDKPPPTPQTRQEAEQEVKKWSLSDAHISKLLFKKPPKPRKRKK